MSPDGFVVTSAHVVSGCRSLAVFGADGRARPSYPVAADPRRDIALLWTDGRLPGQAAVAARTPPHAGEDVFTLGFGIMADRPLSPVVSRGSLVGDGTARPGNRVLVIRARLQAGNSGGALLDGEGALLGMIIGRDEQDPDRGVAIPSADIEALLAAYGIVLPSRDAGRDARARLGAISVLIQCAPP